MSCQLPYSLEIKFVYIQDQVQRVFSQLRHDKGAPLAVVTGLISQSNGIICQNQALVALIRAISH